MHCFGPRGCDPDLSPGAGRAVAIIFIAFVGQAYTHGLMNVRIHWSGWRTSGGGSDGAAGQAPFSHLRPMQPVAPRAVTTATAEREQRGTPV